MIIGILAATLGTAYRPSTGITVVIGSVTATGWQATATTSLTAKTCTIDLDAGSTTEGVPLCQQGFAGGSTG